MEWLPANSVCGDTITELVDRLASIRGRGERCTDVILRLARVRRPEVGVLTARSRADVSFPPGQQDHAAFPGLLDALPDIGRSRRAAQLVGRLMPALLEQLSNYVHGAGTGFRSP